MFFALEPSVVTSPCPLLPAEAANEFSPQVCMQVPSHSAWIPLELDIAAFADSQGEIAMTALEHALVACVDDGDKLHDQTEWAEPLIEYDSWLNRRLAIALRGWGDIVDRRGVDPASLQTLRDMEQLAEWVCRTVHDRSRYLAQQSNWCPALDEAGALVMQKKQSRAWGRRWRKAVRDVAVRHRNLTTMSPWDVFPRGKRADLRYADLLPLTRFADSLSFQRDVSIAHWNVSDFKGFYERVSAIVRCNNDAGLVAKQV
ncbi:MAG: hypothetical protein IH838_09890 [Proteobacteria bacterium]|nr:hypothetical protein [Pseudomonadota bacterium]MCH9005586.1 hypothetical protein [Pseudomonadota bacterium]